MRFHLAVVMSHAKWAKLILVVYFTTYNGVVMLICRQAFFLPYQKKKR